MKLVRIMLILFCRRAGTIWHGRRRKKSINRIIDFAINIFCEKIKKESTSAVSEKAKPDD